MLIDNENLYEALEGNIRRFYNSDEYVYVNAIYGPGDDEELHKGMYHAAVDIHEPGETYHVWFIANDDNSIMVDTIERWLMG